MARYFGTAKRLTMSSILIRPSATDTVRSVSANTGRMISLTRAAPLGSASVFDGNGSAQDIVSRNCSAIPAEFVTTVRPTDTSKDAVTDQGLQDRFKMSWRKPVPRRQCLRRNRASPRIDGDVYHCSNGEEALAGHQRHLGHDSRWHQIQWY